jgi:hypothetical protein
MVFQTWLELAIVSLFSPRRHSPDGIKEPSGQMIPICSLKIQVDNPALL